MTKPTLYLDIDSTVWAAENEYDAAALELYGIPFNTGRWYANEELVETFGPDYTKLFRHALKPDKVHERKLYPGAHWALLDLNNHFNLHFISHNPFPNEFYRPVHKWLSMYLMDFALTITPDSQCKINMMHDDMDAWGIIEDKAETIERAWLSGYDVLVREHPWNLDVREEYGIMSFTDWLKVPDMVKELAFDYA